jgi:hypothetical protein
MERRLEKRRPDCPYVFHRNGKQIKSFRRALNTACADAGLGGTVPHDMRRSGIRNFTKAGLGESEGMSISGHRTNSIYKRYNIIDEDLQRSSLQRVYAGERGSQSGSAQTGWTKVIEQTSDKGAIFEGKGKVIFLGQAHDWESPNRVSRQNLREKFGGEGGIRTPVTQRVNVISSSRLSTAYTHSPASVARENASPLP